MASHDKQDSQHRSTGHATSGESRLAVLAQDKLYVAHAREYSFDFGRARYFGQSQFRLLAPIFTNHAQSMPQRAQKTHSQRTRLALTPLKKGKHTYTRADTHLLHASIPTHLYVFEEIIHLPAVQPLRPLTLSSATASKIPLLLTLRTQIHLAPVKTTSKLTLSTASTEAMMGRWTQRPIRSGVVLAARPIRLRGAAAQKSWIAATPTRSGAVTSLGSTSRLPDLLVC